MIYPPSHRPVSAYSRFHWTTSLALSGAVPMIGALLALATVPWAAYETGSPWVALSVLGAIVAPMLGFYWYAMRRMDATYVELAAEDKAQADAEHEARMRAIRGEPYDGPSTGSTGPHALTPDTGYHTG